MPLTRMARSGQNIPTFLRSISMISLSFCILFINSEFSPFFSMFSVSLHPTISYFPSDSNSFLLRKGKPQTVRLPDKTLYFVLLRFTHSPVLLGTLLTDCASRSLAVLLQKCFAVKKAAHTASIYRQTGYNRSPI